MLCKKAYLYGNPKRKLCIEMRTAILTMSDHF